MFRQQRLSALPTYCVPRFECATRPATAIYKAARTNQRCMHVGGMVQPTILREYKFSTAVKKS